MTKKKMDRTFKVAASLMFPQLEENDSRLIEVASYAKNMYYKNPEVPICVMCSILGKSTIFRDFYLFCQKLGVDPGKREVIISDEKLFFSNDYANWPIEYYFA